MDAKPIAFSGSNWRVNLGNEVVVDTHKEKTYYFNYGAGLLSNKYPQDGRTGNPSLICIIGPFDKRDYIEILDILSDRDDNRYLSVKGDTLRFVFKCISTSQTRVITVLDYILDRDFIPFSTNSDAYGYHSIKKKIYMSDIPGYDTIDVLILGVNVKQGGPGNEYGVLVRHASFS